MIAAIQRDCSGRNAERSCLFALHSNAFELAQSAIASALGARALMQASWKKASSPWPGARLIEQAEPFFRPLVRPSAQPPGRAGSLTYSGHANAGTIYLCSTANNT